MRASSPLSRRLYKSFGLLLAILLLLVVFSFFNFRRLAEANERNLHSYRVLLETHLIAESLFMMDSGVRGYTIGGNRSALKEFEQGRKLYAYYVGEVRQMTADRPAHQHSADRLARQGQVLVEKHLRPIIALRGRISDPQRAILAVTQLAPGRRKALDAMRQTLSDIESLESAIQNERAKSQGELQLWTQWTLVLGGLFSIFTTAGLVTVAARSSSQLDAANRGILEEKRLVDVANAQLAQTNILLQGEIAQRREAESKLGQSVNDLERSNAELEQFAYVASHDLQEPLRAVAGCVQVLQRRYQGQLDDRADQFILHAVEGAHRMQNLIQDLLSYSRVGTKVKEFERVELEAVFAAVMRQISVAVRESNAQITHDALPALRCDPGQMGQVLQNLLSNAVKFRGEAPPRIHLGCRLKTDDTGPKMWIFSVQDDGPGIEAQYFERIFVMFQRLHNRTEYPGTGIGLAICKKIIERHGGEIGVESEPGHGSCFWFSLPAELSITASPTSSQSMVSGETDAQSREIMRKPEMQLVEVDI